MRPPRHGKSRSSPAFIFDIDGTLAIRSGRDPYDWSLVHADLPNQAIVDVARSLHHAGHQLLYVSGRPDDVRHATELWLHEHVGVEAPLMMRPRGDYRSDIEIKREIYLNEIEPNYRVIAVSVFGGIEAGAGNNGLLTFPANLHGNPAISVPAGFIDGLPVGLHIIGRHFSEQLLLDANHRLEQLRPWPLVA